MSRNYVRHTVLIPDALSGWATQAGIDAKVAAAVDDALATDPALAPLATPGAEGEVLTVVSGVPDWAPPTGGGGHITYLNDLAGVDPTGATNMAATIQGHLNALAAAGRNVVYVDAGSIYRLDDTVTVPAGMTILGPSMPNPEGAANLIAEFRAGAAGITMLNLAGRNATIRGVSVNLNNLANVVGINATSNANIHTRISDFLIRNIAATSTGIRMGGALYATIRDGVFSGMAGRGIDALTSYSTNPAVVYYGINVGLIENVTFTGGVTAIRNEGIVTVRHCQFEGTYSGPALEIASPTASSYTQIEDNYFELYGNAYGILLASGIYGRVVGNIMFGANPVAAGSYAVKVDSYSNALDISGNHFARFATGIATEHGVAASFGGALDIGANNFSTVTTRISGTGEWGLADGRMAGSSNTTAARSSGLVHTGNGRIVHIGALGGGAVYWADSHGTTLDLRQGNMFHLERSGAGTLTPTNGTPGQRFSLYFASANITLGNASWNLASGTSETPAVGKVKDFIVDYWGVVREVKP